jgi:hypothetical protein
VPVFPVDQPVRLTIKTYSDAAETTLADPTTLSVDIESPDSAVATYTLAASQVVQDSLGTFHFDYTPAAGAGRYQFHWKATGTVATAQDGSFDVDAEYGYGTVSVDDFAVYINNPDLDRTRARSVLNRAQRLCETIVKPLPDGAEDVVIDVAERAYMNPTALQSQGLGFFDNEGTAATSVGGLYLTRENKATLRRLAGGGGAFTIDMTPAGAGQNLPWWDAGAVLSGDWDAPSG